MMEGYYDTYCDSKNEGLRSVERNIKKRVKEWAKENGITEFQIEMCNRIYSENHGYYSYNFAVKFDDPNDKIDYVSNYKAALKRINQQGGK